MGLNVGGGAQVLLKYEVMSLRDKFARNFRTRLYVFVREKKCSNLPFLVWGVCVYACTVYMRTFV